MIDRSFLGNFLTVKNPASRKKNDGKKELEKKQTLNFAYVKFKFQFGINTCRPRLLSSGESLSYFLLFFFFFNEAPSLRIKKIMSLVYGLRKHYFFDILFR